MSEPQSARGKMFKGAGSNTGDPEHDAQPPEALDEERRDIKRRNDAEAEEAKAKAKGEEARAEHQPPNPGDKARKPAPGVKVPKNK